MHIVTLTFDDGFLKSSLKTAGIFEKFGLSASINIVATGHWKNFTPKDQWHVPMGSFDDWNDLQARGHEIMPHGYMHANKSKLKLAEAQQLILECLSIFSQQLNNFNPKEAVFNFPYNASTPELEAWLPSVVKAFRTAGGGVNRLPSPGQTKLTTCGFGPENCEQHLDQELVKFLAMPAGWLIYNAHGLDDEGWGPLGSDYLERLLERLLKVQTVRILPIGRALSNI